MKREFVQLAHVLNLKKHIIAGMYVSEKLDGERAVWDGGVSRGLYADEVPWANVEKDKKRVYATGLWTRGGKVVHAPTWFLDQIPKAVIDGELFAGRGKFQGLSSIVRNQSGTSDWRPVQYRIYDAPPPTMLFGDGDIKDTRFKKEFRGCYEWWLERAKGVVCSESNQSFQNRQNLLGLFKWAGPCILHPQSRLPETERSARATLDAMLDEVLLMGGEGLILKSASSLWVPERSHSMLKYKPWNDMEAEVIGYTTGRETDLGSKLLGMMGALICKIPAGEFKVSGFTDLERELSARGGHVGTQDAREWARENPEAVCPGWIHNPKFPRGTVVTIKYRELTDSKLPKEGRYWRKFSA